MDTLDVADASLTPARSGRTYRVESVDVLRGLLMVIMALDHTRDYFSNVAIDPTDPMYSWPALFITRWITHICAPGFILLAGASVYLQRQRKSTAVLTCLPSVRCWPWLSSVISSRYYLSASSAQRTSVTEPGRRVGRPVSRHA
jgi:hypothetical protein